MLLNTVRHWQSLALPNDAWNAGDEDCGRECPMVIVSISPLLYLGQGGTTAHYGTQVRVSRLTVTIEGRS